jgi:hypothetical protein
VCLNRSWVRLGHGTRPADPCLGGVLLCLSYLNLGQPTTSPRLKNTKDFTKVPFPVTYVLHTVLQHLPFCNVAFCNIYRFVTVTVL